MMFWLFVSVFVAAVVCVGLGRNRALAVVNGEFSRLHSLPSYHGGWLAMACAGPALALLVLWSLIAPRIERALVFDWYADRLSGLGPAQLEGLWRDIRAGGGAQGLHDALRADAVRSYADLHAAGMAVLAVLRGGRRRARFSLWLAEDCAGVPRPPPGRGRGQGVPDRLLRRSPSSPPSASCSR